MGGAWDSPDYFFSPTEFTTQDDDDDRKETDAIGDVMIETKQD